MIVQRGHYRFACLGHTLMEMVVAMTVSAVLLAGLGSVMMIARQVAYSPSAAARRTEAADVVNQIAEELRYATLIVQQTPIVQQAPQILEFVVADRNSDGAAEKIRYEWSGIEREPLNKTVNGGTGVVVEKVYDCSFELESIVIPGPPAARTFFTNAVARLQAGVASHSRIDSAIPLASQPEQLSAYWRTDFDRNPTTIDVDRDGNSDWIASNGATFVANPDAVHSPGELSGGTWYANGDLASNLPNDFTTVTIVEARCMNMASGAADVLRINADRQGAAYAPLVVRLERRADGSQSLFLLGIPSSGVPVTLPADAGSILSSSTVNNLKDDYVQFRLIILPLPNKVNLQINGVDVGTFTYTPPGPASTERCVKIGGGAKFDYVELRVAPN